MPITIHGSIALEPMPDGKRWSVKEGFDYESADDAHYLRVNVPAGMPTDLASIPRIFWRWLPPFGTYTAAAIVHDRLCYDSALSRAITDAVFYQALSSKIIVRQDNGFTSYPPTPRLKRWIIYAAVRLHWLFQRRTWQ